MRRKLAIYGAGVTGHSLYRILSAREEGPIAVFDSNPSLWGRKFEGDLRVSSPNDLARFDGDIVVACAGGMNLRETLLKFGTLRIDYSLNWEYQWRQIILPLLDPDFATFLKRLERSLSDDKSREILEFLLSNPNPDSATIEKLEVSRDYFSALSEWDTSSSDVLVLGAHTGEEILALAKQNLRPMSLTLVEPDQEAQIRLTELVESMKFEGITEIVSAVIGGKPGIGTLTGDGPSRRVQRVGEAPSAGHGSVFRTIDSFGLCSTGRKGVITMDIEGYEVEALGGAIETINSGNVAWAVSAYHKPRDLFHILEAFDKGSTSYDFQLRMLDFGLVDLTLLATPKD